jgi:hypothetical protein
LIVNFLVASRGIIGDNLVSPGFLASGVSYLSREKSLPWNINFQAFIAENARHPSLTRLEKGMQNADTVFQVQCFVLSQVEGTLITGLNEANYTSVKAVVSAAAVIRNFGASSSSSTRVFFLYCNY